MKLITKEIAKQIEANPLYAHEAKDAKDVKVIAKFFNSWVGGTWYVTEGTKQEDGNIVFFGLCVMQDAELGYVTLSDLESINVERDLYWEGTLADAQKEHK
jgi:hypothetical protein